MTDPAMQSQAYPPTINALTSLRFFGALAVFIDHVLYYITRPPHDNFTLLLYKGHMGVDFFFVLSGFILTHVYYSRVLAGTFSVRKFLVNRIARIYPLHVVAMAAVLVIALVRGHWGNDTGIHALVTNLLLVQDWGFDKKFSFNPPAWSISAEWFAYLIFPLLILLPARRLDSLSFLIVALGFFGAMWVATASVLQIPFTGLTLPFGTLRILPEFCFGMGLYIFGQSKPRLSGDRVSLSLCLVGIIALFFYAGAGRAAGPAAGLADFSGGGAKPPRKVWCIRSARCGLSWRDFIRDLYDPLYRSVRRMAAPRQPVFSVDSGCFISGDSGFCGAPSSRS
jgi:peptidoglycan/LPS O-acetylase OafA/YrhL